MTLTAMDRLALYTIETFASDHDLTCNPNIKVDGVVDSAEMKLFHDAMERNISWGLESTDDEKVAYEFAEKMYQYSSRNSQFSLRYWTGITDDAGNKIYDSQPKFAEPFIMADVFGTNPDGKTTISELISERIALAWDCVVSSTPLGSKTLEMSLCFFDPITTKGRLFDAALYSYSESLYLIVFGEVLKLDEVYNPSILEIEPETEGPKKLETEFLIYYPEEPINPDPIIEI